MLNSSKILIIGGGGREHALAWKLGQSPKVGKIFVAPGNAGTSLVAENVSIPATDIGGLMRFSQDNGVDLTVVGSDDPLALGIVDLFQSKNLKIWGPTKAAAQMEWSKSFAKDLMKRAGVPTAEYQTFTDYNQAWAYAQKVGAPIVVKASGLALGKGVTVCQTLEQAETALRDAMVNKIFGEAGTEVVIEEFLQGREFSAHAFCDGKTFQLLPPSQDHKRAYDGDKGPNTGGMGTIAPVPWVSQKMMEEVSSTIVKPALEGLKNLGSPFVGLLYPGLMNVAARRGVPSTEIKIIEFNARFGDPETQSYMRLLKTDLFDILQASVEGRLADVNIEWEKKFACCIVLASEGYPGKYEKGKIITGIDKAESMDGIIVFHAGTSIPPLVADPDRSVGAKGGLGGVITNGGRVLGVTAIADDLQSALNKAYAAVKLIHFDGMQYRKDIGKKSLNGKG